MEETFFIYTDIAMHPDLVIFRSENDQTVATVYSRRFGRKIIIVQNLVWSEQIIKDTYLKALSFLPEAPVSVVVRPFKTEPWYPMNELIQDEEEDEYWWQKD